MNVNRCNYHEWRAWLLAHGVGPVKQNEHNHAHNLVGLDLAHLPVGGVKQVVKAELKCPACDGPLHVCIAGGVVHLEAAGKAALHHKIANVLVVLIKRVWSHGRSLIKCVGGGK